MIYRNVKTGAEFESNHECKGEGWEPVKAPDPPKAPPPKKGTKKSG